MRTTILVNLQARSSPLATYRIYAHHLLRSFENQHKKAQAQFFLVRVLASFLEDRPCFCLVASVALLGFILGLAMVVRYQREETSLLAWRDCLGNKWLPTS